MRVKTKVSFADYAQLNFSLYYRKPLSMLVALVGFMLLIFAVLSFEDKFHSGQSPIFLCAIGVMVVVVIPFFIYQNSKRNYYSNLRLQEEIEYDFTNDKLKMTGTSFNAELNWDKTYKIEELKKFFLIYGSKQIANLLPKNDMTSAEIAEARNIFQGLSVVKIKKLKG